ncbi:lysophospholipase [Ostertagia ostertagi]
MLLRLNLHFSDAKEVPGHTVSFSGYPAQLSSADDYTLTSAGLGSIETTIAIFNKSLYTDTYIKPEGQVHCWLRSTISNYLTKTPKEWVELFSRYNSGTYNNQWTVVDYKQFKPGQEIPDKDMLWILEQTPGSIKTQDVTWFLKKYSYWPSYNVPFIKDISIEAGFSEKAREFDWYKWGSTPRARIFERDHHKVQDMDSLTKLMR